MCTGWQGTRQLGGGLSHLEPPKSQPTLEFKSSQVGVPTWSNMFLHKGFIDQIIDVAHVHGVAGTMQNHADR